MRDYKHNWLWVRSPFEEIKYLFKFIFSYLGSRVEAKRGVEFLYSTSNDSRMFLLHINDMLEDSSIHCYADDSTVDTVYSGRASLSRGNAEQSRNKLVPSVEASLDNISS